MEETLQQQQDIEIKTKGLHSLGNIFRLVGDLDESRRVLQQSLAKARQLASPQDLSATFLSLGNTARAQQDSSIKVLSICHYICFTDYANSVPTESTQPFARS